MTTTPMKLRVADRARQPRTTTKASSVLRAGWGMIPLIGFGLLLLVGIFGPMLVPYDPTTVVGRPSQAPSAEFWFGTDTSGMDVFSRTIAATRIDLMIALTCAIACTILGIIVGVAIGMVESHRSLSGHAARIMSRGLDLLQAVPSIVLGLVVVAFLGPTDTTLILAITVLLIPLQARQVRTEVLRVRREPYLDAARLAGRTETSLTIKHVIPNSVWPALENLAVMFGIAMTLTAALGFLGVGLPPPTPEWGSMMTRGASDAGVGRWWSFIFPAAALSISVLLAASASARLFRTRR